VQKECKQCKSQFTVEDADLEFYKKISPIYNKEIVEIDVPHNCPQCREKARISWRNERKLYRRECHLCKNEIISIFSPDKNYRVCCSKCFWSDKWDPIDQGVEYDSNKPFFKQFEDLYSRSKLLALFGSNNENSEFVNHETDDKDCYMQVGGHYNRDCYYCTYSIKGDKNVDCIGCLRAIIFMNVSIV